MFALRQRRRQGEEGGGGGASTICGSQQLQLLLALEHQCWQAVGFADEQGGEHCAGRLSSEQQQRNHLLLSWALPSFPFRKPLSKPLLPVTSTRTRRAEDHPHSVVVVYTSL